MTVIRQLLYVSRAPAGEAVPLEPIYEASRHNNAIDGVTGLLLGDGSRFMQVLEGSPASVAETFRRIALDPRHRDIEVLHDAQVAERQFGTWAMADRRRGERADELDERLRYLLRRAPATVRDAFLDLLVPA